jgi:hypothetical protein
MRWKYKQWKHGEIRIIKKFVFFPISINEETRWLEWVELNKNILHYFGEIENS